MAKRIATYILSAIVTTFILYKSKHLGHIEILWIFFAIMGLSAIVSRWNTGNSNKSKIVLLCNHLTYIGFLSLIFFVALIKLIQP